MCELPSSSSDCTCEACTALRAAAAEGAHPKNVPLRVYGGYLEARAALRGNAPAAATRVLEWLIGHVAEERGAKPEQTFAAKVKRLQHVGAISPALPDALLDHAFAAGESHERAWALLSITEHVFYRLFLRPAA
jgi:hypothetical protein